MTKLRVTSQKSTASSPLAVSPKPKLILACGTFDLLHPGHIFFLKQASALAEKLIVLIAQDSTIQRIKGQLPSQNLKTRKEKVAKLPFVSKVKAGAKNDFLSLLRELQPDLLALGYDQRLPFPETDLHSALPTLKLVRLSAYKPAHFKTSFLKRK